MKYTLITADGKKTKRARMSLKQMQKFVDGYIEEYGDYIFNEDGLAQLAQGRLERNVVIPEIIGNVIIKED